MEIITPVQARLVMSLIPDIQVQECSSESANKQKLHEEEEGKHVTMYRIFISKQSSSWTGICQLSFDLDSERSHRH